MLVRRVVVGLLGVGALAVGPVAVPPAATAAYHRPPDPPKATISTGPAPGTGVEPAGTCTVTNHSGHPTGYACGAGWVFVTWTRDGTVIGHDDVTIGRDHRVYDDPGTGSRWLQGGVAGGPVPVGVFGHSDVTTVTISMIGTDGYGYCATTTGPGAWTGWTRCV